MKFETTAFKEQHNSLYNEFTTKIHYAEYKAIGGDHDEQSN